jgi:hypothetical protein
VPISKLASSLTVFAALIGLAAHSSDAYARVDLNMVVWHEDPPTPSFPFPNTHYAMERWSADGGQRLVTFRPNDPFHESIDALAAGPGGRLYAAANNIGQIQILRFSMVTGREIDPPFSIFATFGGGPVGDMKVNPLDGGLYVGAPNGFPATGGDVIRRVNVNNGSIQVRELAISGTINDLDFSPDGQFLHVLGASRLSTYSLHGFFPQNPFPFPLPFPIQSPTPLPPAIALTSFPVSPSANQFVRGPDSLFYVSDFLTNNVLRHTLTGQFVDEFIDQPMFDLNFVEGRLFGRSGFRVYELNPQTGDIIDTLIDGETVGLPSRLSFADIAAVADIPEPTTLGLTLTAALGLLLTCRTPRKYLRLATTQRGAL